MEEKKSAVHPGVILIIGNRPTLWSFTDCVLMTLNVNDETEMYIYFQI